ncbi:YkuS family protein [Lentibacillus salicampi]|uniref:Uncharacterized protein n=1 Tax=Lentibacillus salicampi TaxID=175306 RepID=A0A4Y9AGT0_9BACI|nr:YkuS family protein [Lentibacillus salicampi]TFJ94615.1 hypothetical protein E4U82_01495 [Lentibacillus salicampi]
MARVWRRTTDVQQPLKEREFDVVPLQSENDAGECDNYGQDIQNVATQGFVIEVRGLRKEDVCQEVETE